MSQQSKSCKYDACNGTGIQGILCPKEIFLNGPPSNERWIHSNSRREMVIELLTILPHYLTPQNYLHYYYY